MSRYLAAWLIGKHEAAMDLCSMATERDRALSRAKEAHRRADRAVAKAVHCCQRQAETQAQFDSLRDDFEAYVLTGERRG